MRRVRVLGIAGTLALLGGCATIHPAPPLPLDAPQQWANRPEARLVGAPDQKWWARLGDPVVDRLIDQALTENPTIAEALARVDQARATLDSGRAAQAPRADVSGGISYGQQNLGTAGGVNAVNATAATISPSLSWELDLWGRVGHTVMAARRRLDARTADADAARLDALFDKHLVTFEDDGRIMISSQVSAENRARLGLDPAARIRGLDARHARYLAHHRARFLA